MAEIPDELAARVKPLRACFSVGGAADGSMIGHWSCLNGFSAVTLWRWRHDKNSGFPATKQVNGRLYFSFVAVS